MVIRQTFRQPLPADSANDIILFNFPLFLNHEKLAHAVFSRHGGISKPPYNSLNVAFNTSDSSTNVSFNLNLIKEHIHGNRLIFMNQVHGSEIISIKDRHSPDPELTLEADALITDIPDTALMVKQADCQSVIFFDPVKRVIANAHCGWRGNTLNILSKVVDCMKTDFECRSSDIIAAIGPSLGPCCSEFISYKDIFPEESNAKHGKPHPQLCGDNIQER